jgi:hypothetical protein
MINVYLISVEADGRKLYKIGYTRRNVSDRIKEFDTGNAQTFIIENVFNSKWGTKIEAQLHKFFKESKVKGEWFNLTDDDVLVWINQCKLYHKNFEIIEKQNTYYIDRGERF